LLRSALLDSVPGLVHGLSTREDGSIGPITDSAARARRAFLVGALTGRPRPPVAPRQVHGDRVAVVRTDADRPGDADGVATARADVPLMVQGADCPLLALVDPGAPALALVHSGWRGTVAHVAARGVKALETIGARAERLHAAVFPGIGPCCFEVGPEVVEAVRFAFGDRADAWHVPSGRPGHALLDLHAAIRASLTDVGVARVDAVSGCTACGGTLWSHRASGGAPERHGLFAALV
jgi:YfiH family protein